MKKLFAVMFLSFFLSVVVSAQSGKQMLFRSPTMNRTDIAFVFAMSSRCDSFLYVVCPLAHTGG